MWGWDIHGLNGWGIYGLRHYMNYSDMHVQLITSCEAPHETLVKVLASDFGISVATLHSKTNTCHLHNFL